MMVGDGSPSILAMSFIHKFGVGGFDSHYTLVVVFFFGGGGVGVACVFRS